MTVNELITELQVLVAQGYGELNVCLENSEDISTVICYPAKVAETGLSGWDSTISPYILLQSSKSLPRFFE